MGRESSIYTDLVSLSAFLFVSILGFIGLLCQRLCHVQRIIKFQRTRGRIVDYPCETKLIKRISTVPFSFAKVRLLSLVPSGTRRYIGG